MKCSLQGTAPEATYPCTTSCYLEDTKGMTGMFLDCNIPALQSLRSSLIYKRQWGENEAGIAVSDVQQVSHQLMGGQGIRTATEKSWLLNFTLHQE